MHHMLYYTPPKRRVVMRLKNVIGILLSLFALVIVGCSDDGPKTTPFTTAPTASVVTPSASGTTATSVITATLPAGTADGTVVTFTIASGSGTLSSATATTVGGVASVTLTGTAPGDVVVVVSSGNLASPVTVTFAPGTLVVTANATIAINTASVISAQLPTAAAGVTVSFTLTGAGTLSAATAVTDATGLATVTLTAPATPGSATVTAKAGLLIGNVVAVTYITDPNAPGGISIVANPTTIFVGGSSTITATVTPAGVGGVIADGTVVTFATSVGTITASATTTGGVATATLTSAVTGTASVTASVSGIASAPAPVVINALPVQAVVKLAINGTLPAGTTIDGAQFILNYVTTKGLSIVDAGIVASGVATSNLIISNLTVPGVVNTAMANLPAGATIPPIATQTGEFATLTFTITGATVPFPALADFTLDAVNSSVATTPVLATPLTISVLSVTLL
jgi:adhesin/invasin